MKRVLFAAAALATLFGSAAYAGDQSVHGYTRRDGTYVAPYHRSTPNNTRDDNYSTRGNVNPYTGEEGTKPRDEDTYQVPSYTAPSYSVPTYAPAYGSNDEDDQSSSYGQSGDDDDSGDGDGD